MIGWIIGIFVVLVLVVMIIRRYNQQEEEDYEPRSRLKKFLDACCLHRK